MTERGGSQSFRSGRVSGATTAKISSRGFASARARVVHGRAGMQDHSFVRGAMRSAHDAAVVPAADSPVVADSERMEAVGQLASGVAHEFNNMLSVILSSARFAREELPESHPASEDLDEVLDAAERAQSLASKLLALSRRKPVTPELVSVNAVVEGMARLLRHLLNENTVLRFELAPSPGLVRIDPTCFELVIVNLVANARDAMQNGGELVLATRRGESAAERLAGGPCVVFEVRDQGAGMNEEVRARVFERFFTTKPFGVGTGLGLATCRDIVTQAGGIISVDSATGRGSTFRVCLPLVAKAGSGTRARVRQPKSTRPRASGETVLNRARVSRKSR